jgi:hypothetical protein
MTISPCEIKGGGRYMNLRTLHVIRVGEPRSILIIGGKVPAHDVWTRSDCRKDRLLVR